MCTAPAALLPTWRGWFCPLCKADGIPWALVSLGAQLSIILGLVVLTTHLQPRLGADNARVNLAELYWAQMDQEQP